MTRLALLALAGLALACAPQLRGECVSDEACPLATRCIEGLCLTTSEPRVDGGHEQGCSEACPAGYRCSEALECVPESGSIVEILSPSTALRRSGAMLPVRVRASAPGAITTVDVSLDGLAFATLTPSPQAGPDLFEGSLDVPASTQGVHTLTATARWSGGEWSAELALTFDGSGPTITPEPLSYPRVRAGFEADAFSPGEPIEVLAFVDDRPAGLEGPPVLVEGTRRTPGEDLGQGRWRFTLPARAPAKLEAEIDLTIEATDAVGNPSSRKVQARVSRHAWRWVSPQPRTITAAPALVGDRVVFGDEDGVVTALQQADGALAWQVVLDAAVVGHVSASPDDLVVHAVTSSGTAYWIDASPQAGERVMARCPQTGVLGRTPAAGASVAGDTLFVVSRDGYLQVMRPRPFLDGDDASCLQEHDLRQGAGVSAASLSPRAGGVDVYVATRTGRLLRVDVELADDEAPVFANAWTQSVSPQADVRGAPALGRVETKTSIVVGTDASRVFGGDAQGGGLSISGKLLTSAIVAGPALVAGDAYLIDQTGEAQRLRLADGKKLWSPSFRGLARGADALAGPVVGRSGNTCLVTGKRLSCVTPAGEVRWSHDDPAGHLLDAVTPALGCDGRLFVASSAGALEAFDTDTDGPADGWFRPGGDARNTSNVAAPPACD